MRNGLLMVLFAIGCGGSTGPDDDGQPPTPTVNSIRLNLSTAMAARGQKVQLEATPLDAAGTAITGKTISWTTSDVSVATVDATGGVTGAAAGSARITASVDGKTAESAVTIIAFSAIQSGSRNTCALSLDGRLFCAGAEYGERARPEGGSLRFTALTSNSEPQASTVAHYCALTAAGVAYCWGTNAFGELGVGDLTNRTTPTAVAGSLTFASLTAGQHHTCGVTTSGDAYCWGDGATGQTGNPGATSASQPVAVVGVPKLSQLQAGNFHSCGLTSDGRTYCWGRNNVGQLGNGQSGDPSTPSEVSGGVVFKSLASKWNWTCGLTVEGKAYCWGDDTLGQLGQATGDRCDGDKPCVLKPSAVATSLAFTSMAMSQFATCATTTQPQLYCWGGDMQNQFGASPPPTGCDISGFNFGCTPVPTAGPAGFPVVTGSPRNFCGVATSGIAYCWGGNDLKQIGNPAVTLSATPVVFTIDPSSSL